MFDRRTTIFAVLALVLGASGAYANFVWLGAQKPETVTRLVERAVETTHVVIARSDLGAGAEVRNALLTSVEWPSDLLPAGAFTDPRALEGRVPRRLIAQGEPVLEAALLAEGADAGLSPIIAAGHRAVAVKVDEVIGIAGFVKPGARVDVLATIRNRSSRDSFSNVILQDTKVLAIDQSLEEGSGASDPKLVSVVTLEVTPSEAERLTFGAHEGKLQLALRNPSDGDVVRTSSASASTLRGKKPARRVARRTTPVEIIQGLVVSQKSF